MAKLSVQCFCNTADLRSEIAMEAIMGLSTLYLDLPSWVSMCMLKLG